MLNECELNNEQREIISVVVVIILFNKITLGLNNPRQTVKEKLAELVIGVTAIIKKIRVIF